MNQYLAWARERFPLINIFSSYLLYALTAAVVRHDLHGEARWTWIDCLLGFAVALQFLLLRVLDEHKDFKDDTASHPERVLQRGLIHLADLRVLGIIAGIGVLLITLARGFGLALGTWALMSAWTLLMTVEFFAREWLKRRLIIYSISHMLVLPFMILWMATLAEGNALQSTSLPWLLGITLVNGLIYEVLRKTKGQDEEIQGVETFSRTWGTRRAAWFAMGLHFLSILLYFLFVEKEFEPAAKSFLPLLAALVLTVLCLLQYMRQPEAKSRKANEGASALYVLIAYGSLIAFAMGV